MDLAGAPAVAVAAFEPRADTGALVSMAVVLAATGGAAWFWWAVLVPSERASVGRSKRMGALGQYLDDLENSEGRSLERWFYTDWLRQRRCVASAGSWAGPCVRR